MRLQKIEGKVTEIHNDTIVKALAAFDAFDGPVSDEGDLEAMRGAIEVASKDMEERESVRAEGSLEFAMRTLGPIINSTPDLLSLLYDANLLPEQVASHRDVVAMTAIVVGYKMGMDRGRSSFPPEESTLNPPQPEGTRT